MKKLLYFIGLTVAIFSYSQNGIYKKEVFIENKDTLRYRILYPKNFDSTQKYPMVIFLHGAGERGSDNEKQLVHGANLFQSALALEQYPAIIIFPQCPQNEYWANVEINRNTSPFEIAFPQNATATTPLKKVMKLISNYKEKPFVDNQRIYVGGISMGGMGTYEILYRMPQTFAAAFVICGAGNVELAKEYAKQTPLWIFHGAKDNIVEPKFALEMSSALLSYGAYPNLTLYSQDNHNSWDSAMQEPNLLPWLFTKFKMN